MSIEITITIAMFGCMLLLMTTGLPIPFCLGIVAVVFGFFLWGFPAIGMLSTSMWGFMNNFLLVCVPLFIFMAYMLERSGIADGLYTSMHNWFGPLRGGLAMGTVVICTIFAAMSGTSVTGTLTMGVIALPAMLKRGYDKSLTVGSIMAGGALGTLIPPSIPFVIYCLFANASVGRLFLAGIIPGIFLSGMFIIYIGIRSGLRPELGPPLPPEERVNLELKIKSMRTLILPVLLVVAVLGTIFAGIATPTEAAAVGAFGSIICAAINRRLSFKNFSEVAASTVRIGGFVIFIVGFATAFSSVYYGLGAAEFIRTTMQELAVKPIVIILLIQASLFLLGCFLDPTAIMMITLPIYVPIVSALGYDLEWFGVLFVMNMEMGYLTPPFGVNLFVLKAVVPPEITLSDLYRSVWPFVMIQASGLALVLLVPDVCMYLPNLLMD